MADPWHVRWLREGVKKWNKRRKKISFVPDLSGLRFFDILPPDFRDNPKTSRYFEKIDLSDAILIDSDLSRLNFFKAKFRRANISRADLSRSNFQGADFSGAILSEVTFEDSLLTAAVFDGSQISGSKLARSVLSGANFVGAIMPAADQDFVASMGARIIESTSHEQDHRVVSSDVVARIERTGDKSREEDRKRKNRYDVFFATNRKSISERGAIVDYTGEMKADLDYGVCEVIVPDGRPIGKIGTPLWKRLLGRPDEILRLENLIHLNEALFWKVIYKTKFRMRTKEDYLIFVHGFNTSFQEAVIRAAQIGFDLGVGRGITLFSWPSKGKLGSYAADEAACEASKYSLADFIHRFVTECGGGRVNIVAHSMGCRCVLGALELLANGRRGTLRQVNQVILAAADVDTALMPNLAKHAVKICRRTTSYAAEGDRALKISGWLHEFPRVGIMPPPFVLDGMDTIAVNKKDLGDLRHGYISSSRTVLSDMYNLIKHNFPPDKRHSIVEEDKDGYRFWRLRE